MKVFVAPDGTRWGVDVRVPGSSNALVLFHHPDGHTARKDRYAWYLGHGPESKSVTARLVADKVLDSLTDDDLRRLLRRSVRVSRGDVVGAPSNVNLAAGTSASLRR
jgi:hypothetical protein